MIGLLKESGQHCLGYAQSLSILCCTFVVVSVLPSAYSGTLFAWHPIFMSIGYLIFMCEGISIAYRVRDLDGNSRVGLLTKHLWTQVASIMCVSLGFAAIYVNKNIHGKNHFTSLHGKLGLVTYLLSLTAVSLGVGCFKKLGLVQMLPNSLHPCIKWIHRMIGISTWCTALVTIEVVLPNKAVTNGIIARLFQIAILILGVLVLYVLSDRNGDSSKYSIGLPRAGLVDFTMVPRQSVHKFR